MRFFINYIHSCFCKHEFELIGETSIYENSYSNRSYKCTKHIFVRSVVIQKK